MVCLTNAIENPAHQLQVQEVFLPEYPAHQLGGHRDMLLSHQLSGRKGEYVRATSTIVDSFLHATMYHALSDLEQNLREHGYPRPMLVIHNSGGMAQLNSTDALQTIHSGPVAGISASEHLAAQAGLGNVVATDMGGTSFDIGLVPADGVKHYDFMPVIDRWLVSVPMIHLVTLGAGGGSIASYDRLHQSVKVGPRSAGSDPGPACYDRGGLLTSLDAPPSGRTRPVWFDAATYGRARLLGGGDVPWPASAELSSFFAKIGGMFHSDAILVDLADLLAQRTAADQQLRRRDGDTQPTWLCPADATRR